MKARKAKAFRASACKHMHKPKTRPKPSRREQAKRIALLRAGTLAGFVLCELALRLWTCVNAGSLRPL